MSCFLFSYKCINSSACQVSAPNIHTDGTGFISADLLKEMVPTLLRHKLLHDEAGTVLHKNVVVVLVIIAFT